MSDPREPLPSEVDHAARAQEVPVTGWRRASHISAGLMLSWFIIFVAIFFAAGEAFEGKPLPRWAIPVVGGAAVVCAGVALLVRENSPHFSAGLWIGTAIGLLHAGLCFSAM